MLVFVCEGLGVGEVFSCMLLPFFFFFFLEVVDG
jgi:hypothetical protein